MKNLRVRSAFLAAFAVTLFAGVGPVSAQDAAAALVEEGLNLREQGDDAGALQRFQAAYQVDASPRTLAQIALAEMALSMWLDAEGHLASALGTQHEWVERNRVALNGAMAGIRDHIGRLQVEADQEGSQLFIDGELVGALPLEAPIAREPGPLTFEVRADGFEPESRTVTLAGGQVTREVVRLRVTPTEAEATTDDVFGAPADSGGGVSIPGVVLVAGGGAALVAGAVLLGVAFATKAGLESPDGTPAWSADDQAAADQVPVLAGAGEVALGVGVAALAVGVVLMVIDGGGSEAQSALRDGRVEIRF